MQYASRPLHLARGTPIVNLLSSSTTSSGANIWQRTMSAQSMKYEQYLMVTSQFQLCRVVSTAAADVLSSRHTQEDARFSFHIAHHLTSSHMSAPLSLSVCVCVSVCVFMCVCLSLSLCHLSSCQFVSVQIAISPRNPVHPPLWRHSALTSLPVMTSLSYDVEIVFPLCWWRRSDAACCVTSFHRSQSVAAESSDAGGEAAISAITNQLTSTPHRHTVLWQSGAQSQGLRCDEMETIFEKNLTTNLWKTYEKVWLMKSLGRSYAKLIINLQRCYRYLTIT